MHKNVTASFRIVCNKIIKIIIMRDNSEEIHVG